MSVKTTGPPSVNTLELGHLKILVVVGLSSVALELVQRTGQRRSQRDGHFDPFYYRESSDTEAYTVPEVFMVSSQTKIINGP